MAPKTHHSHHNANNSDRQSSHTAASSVKDGSEGPSSSKPSRTNSPSAASTLLLKMSDSNAASGNSSSSTSQPMAKSSSSSSNPSSSKDAAAASGPSPYGTRSRNRTGQSRPNYAEDKDLDAELFEIYPERRDDEPKKATRQAASSSHASQDPPRSGAASSRKPLPTISDDGKHHHPHGTGQNGSREHHQNASSHNTNSGSSTHGSKKRKAVSQASSATASQAHSVSAARSLSLQSDSRRKSFGTSTYGTTNLMSFENCKAMPKNNAMTADDGTVLAVNDNVYMICEPPGEPYYIGRIMEFLHLKNDATKPVDAIRINWFYRPKDIGRKVQDTRLLFATMHSDISPLTALRGKCTVKHKAEIPNLDEYRKIPDCFWFDKMYDRYIQKNYEVIPTTQIINVPENVKKVLDERWKYILVEQGRGKELTSAVKLCKRCSGYCASNDSVDCAVCQNTYHMNCVRPPLLKKPSRGFAWSCAACSRAQERKLEARNTPNILLDAGKDEAEEEEYEEEDDAALPPTNRTSPSTDQEEHEPPTEEQIYQASLWPYRYLGIHCKIEDALDYDDRIYPRASSRLGPRHQATVMPWPGRPVKYVKPLEVKKTSRKEARQNKDLQLALEKEKLERERRPKWVQDEPPGYVHRGEDLPDDDPNQTSKRLWMPAVDNDGDIIIPDVGIDEYMDQVRTMTKQLGLPDHCTNLEDIARDILYKNNYDVQKSLKEIPKVDNAAYKEPELTAAEQKKFEEGVAKFGSELHSVLKYVKTVPYWNIVRYYYKWKKTDKGKQIWGNYSGRKGKKEIKKAEEEARTLSVDVANNDDDSAFDTEKAMEKKKNFMCKFCHTKSSRQWRRAPNVTAAVVTENGGKAKDRGAQYIVALCRRCAELWRRYAIQWEDMEEVAKKVAQAGGRAWKRRVDEELLKELQAANDRMRNSHFSTPEPQTSNSHGSNGSHALGTNSSHHIGQEPPHKKLKRSSEKGSEPPASDSGSISGVVASKKHHKEKDKEKEKEKVVEKPAPPPAPEMPKAKTMPCAVCHQLEPLGDQHLSCRECRMTVHRNCYGVIDNRHNGKWICDMCSNDKNPQVSINYKCVLCPVEYTEHDFVEPPKISHKKKTEKERERERQEKENAQKAADFYRKRQEELNRPVNPREPLKRTADNNWIHVTCAVWTPEVRFGKAKALEPSEGIPSVPRARYGEVCKACKRQGGACVSCHQCRAPVHVECAHQAGYLLGFDITPVKGSRRDQHNIVTIGGESGTMTAAVWCKEHVPQKTIVHRMQDPVDESGMNALQLYVQNFKQADLALTGCARKATLISTTAKLTNSVPALAANRRASTTTLPSTSAATQASGSHNHDVPPILQPTGKICITCGIDVSPRWYPINEVQERLLTNGYHGSLGVEAKKFVAQRNFQCHKCKKNKRQPRLHPSVEDELPQPQEMSRSSSQAAPTVGSSPGLMDLRSIAPRPWSVERTVVPPPRLPGPEVAAGPSVPVSVPGPIIAPPIAASQVLAPPPPPLAQPPVGQQPMPPVMPPRAGPPPPQQYGHPTPVSAYNDWPRPSSQQAQHPPPSSMHHVNGGPPPLPPTSMSALAPPNHLRPPPLSMAHAPPPPPPLQNGHLSQPMMNGLPPSPRRMSGPPPPPPPHDNRSYISAYHHVQPPPPHHLTNGGPPPRASERPFSQVLNPQRSPFSPPHGSPPMLRDGISLHREPGNPLPRAPETRPASGASASPSLRNLLH